MKCVATTLPDVFVIESPVFGDSRGFFTEVFHADKFAAIGLPTTFVQDNHSRSARHTLRGLHYQKLSPQGKLIRVVSGSIFDVAVDIRRSSPTFGKWCGMELREGDGRQLWIPVGFAHGFLVLSESADVTYKCTTLYDATDNHGIAWNDEQIDIAWPLPVGVAPILSAKDQDAPSLAHVDTFA